jgi:hypothetical protein
MKPWIIIILLLGGIVAVVYPFQIVKTFGHIPWAEQKIGGGGTYAFWRLTGVAMILLSYVAARYL